MKTSYDDNTIDALIAASLRPLKEEPTDEQVEEVFGSAVEPSPEDKEIISSTRESLIAAMSGSPLQTEQTPPVDVAESKFAAMNRDNADDEFDDATKEAIERARRDALDKLQDEGGDEATEEKDD